MKKLFILISIFTFSLSLFAKKNTLIEDIHHYSQENILKQMAPGDRAALSELIREAKNRDYNLQWDRINLFLAQKNLEPAQLKEFSSLLANITKGKNESSMPMGAVYTLIFLVFLAVLYFKTNC